MVNPLIARMNAARERSVPLFDGHSVTVRRPTDLALLEYRADGGITADRMFRCAVGWAGFSEADLVPSGASDAVPFDLDVWLMWIADHPQYWEVVSNAVAEMIQQHTQAGADAAKN